MKTTTLLLLLATALLSSCAKRGELATAETVSRFDLPLPGFKGDTVYAVVRADALPELYEDFRGVLSGQGLVRWDERFDCNRFSTLYIGVAQARYAADSWHSETKAQALALAEVWYVGPRGSHSIVAALTDGGLMFIEPQTGRAIQLSEKERASMVLVKW